MSSNLNFSISDSKREYHVVKPAFKAVYARDGSEIDQKIKDTLKEINQENRDNADALINIKIENTSMAMPTDAFQLIVYGDLVVFR